MARVHTPKRGSSHSSRPVAKRTPAWCSYRPEEAEALVVKLGKEGYPADKIGMILRDQHGIPLTKSVVGKKIAQIIGEAKLSQSVPDDLAALLRKANRMRRHIEKNKGDNTNRHNLQLLESRIHRLAVYYKRTGLLTEDWKYQPVVGSFV